MQSFVNVDIYQICKGKSANFLYNRRLPEPFFVTRLPKGVVTTPSLDFRY